MSIKKIAKRFAYGYRSSSQSYINALRKKGASIGDDVYIFTPTMTQIDMTSPWLLSIGNHVRMTGPVTILTHDFSWSVIKGVTGEVLGNEQPTCIGNNVFIGWGATILCGTEIGDNCIVGAQSVVSGKLEPNSVYAGIPAKRICSLEHYRNKRLEVQLSEAIRFTQQYYDRIGSYPPEDQLHEYFMLFSDGESNSAFRSKLNLMGTHDLSKAVINSGSLRKFQSYKDFLNHVKLQSGE